MTSYRGASFDSETWYWWGVHFVCGSSSDEAVVQQQVTRKRCMLSFSKLYY